ncbi:MAG TPA: hypothetical protein VFK16_10395 [Gemmatimonadaceae bacterium]|nr:hypothetical protein [Gemmatimonadaceae bacterium]
MRRLIYPVRTLVLVATLAAAAACGSDHTGPTGTTNPDNVSLAGEYTAVSTNGGQAMSGVLHMTDTTYQYTVLIGNRAESDSGSYTATREGIITMSHCGGVTGIYNVFSAWLSWYLPCNPGVSVDTYVWQKQ